MIDAKELLISLSNAVGIGFIDEVKPIVKEYLSQFCSVKELDGLGIMGFMDNGKKHTILLEAHIDEVGMIVTNIDQNGFLTVANVGGLDLRSLPARQVVIHSDKKYTGVFCSTPPHLASADENAQKISDIKIDSGLGSDAENHINIGDYVTFKQTAVPLLDTRISGKSLDNRAGVAALLLACEELSKKTLDVNVIFLFSDTEELGHRGAKTAAFSICANEAIAVDVSFGNAPDVAPHQCGVLGKGSMIGMSPVLDSRIYKKLVSLAKEKDISYQTEVMGGTTGTNADTLSLNKEGIPCGLLSIPLRNMHTDVEVIDTLDIVSTAKLLSEYVTVGGALNG